MTYSTAEGREPRFVVSEGESHLIMLKMMTMMISMMISMTMMMMMMMMMMMITKMIMKDNLKEKEACFVVSEGESHLQR